MLTSVLVTLNRLEETYGDSFSSILCKFRLRRPFEHEMLSEKIERCIAWIG